MNSSGTDDDVTKSAPNLTPLVAEGRRTQLEDALVIAWSYAEPTRVGQVAFLSKDPSGSVLGREPSKPQDKLRVRFAMQRPGVIGIVAELRCAHISREQMRITVVEAGIRVELRGRGKLVLNGSECDVGIVKPGELVYLKDQLLLYYTRRPREIPPLKYYPSEPMWAFGDPDPSGIVGETPVVWGLRDALAFIAQSDKHVLIYGQSGTGKELAAQAIHQMSNRASNDMVTRNAKTLPSSIIDAELFGNAANYPNPGMKERPGIVGQANKSTLLLDEIGEMPLDSQAHLLRVIDSKGEYQRLGDSKLLHSSFRLIAATNREPEQLKHDFLSRLMLRIKTLPLQERREDIPLLIDHLLRRNAQTIPRAKVFFEGRNVVSGHPLIHPTFVQALLLREYTHHLRELEELLLRAVMSCETPYLMLDSSSLSTPPNSKVRELRTEGVRSLEASLTSREEILKALKKNQGNVRRTAHELNLSRDQLNRLMTKHNITRAGLVERSEDDTDAG